MRSYNAEAMVSVRPQQPGSIQPSQWQNLRWFVIRTLVRTSTATILVVAIAAAACQPQRIGGDMPLDEVIHELRIENLALTRQIKKFEEETKLHQAQIQVLEQQARRGVEVAAGVAPGDLPRVVTIRFGRYSSALDTNADGKDDLIRLYVRTLDQHGRFLPVAGKADVQVVVIQPDRQPQVIANRCFEPKNLEQAYHSSFMGTHYSLEVSLPKELPTKARYVTVKVTLIDAATGTTLSHEQVLRLEVCRGGS